VNLRVDVIVASGGTAATIAAKNATNTIPVVFTGGGDVVATGLAASFARPGGNLTGVTIGGPELWGKRLELLRETIPKLSRVAYIRNPNSPAQQQQLKEMCATAEALGVQLQILEVLTPNEIAGAFDTAIKAGADGLIVSQVPPISTDIKRIVLLAEKSRLPAIYADGTWPEVGGLMSYAPSYTDQYRRAAIYVDKILKGTKPADLPVEQPKKFEFIINLKTAKQVGLTIPPNVLVRADRVIK
jgi:putative tryptophan/tyrosine transport system substrate-binding protein